VAAFTYWLKTDTVAGTYQLMRYDGYQTDLPIAENIVGLSFEYYGDPTAPLLKKPVTDPKGPWTNYGPKPPPLGTDNLADNWGTGENCLFMVSNGQQVARTEMPALGPANGALVRFSPEQLSDGPWCPIPQISIAMTPTFEDSQGQGDASCAGGRSYLRGPTDHSSTRRRRAAGPYGIKRLRLMSRPGI
jgi:hypothetical protein